VAVTIRCLLFLCISRWLADEITVAELIPLSRQTFVVLRFMPYRWAYCWSLYFDLVFFCGMSTRSRWISIKTLQKNGRVLSVVYRCRIRGHVCFEIINIIQDLNLSLLYQGSYGSGKTGKKSGYLSGHSGKGRRKIFLEKSEKSQGKWKIGATRCQIFRLICIKFDFHWGSLQHSLTPPPSCT